MPNPLDHEVLDLFHRTLCSLPAYKTRGVVREADRVSFVDPLDGERYEVMVMLADEEYDEAPEVSPEAKPGPAVATLGGGDGPQLANRWQDRLVIDPNVSDRSPVVKGTWVTVEHVISHIVDGSTWSDVLRNHPELCEDDIRTCLAYAVAEDFGDL